ncbi:MAG: AAA family ATPase [Deltaproteobacteria bacterium]|nr:AAA family ATPase [Deltaproteobacteria bacterium]
MFTRLSVRNFRAIGPGRLDLDLAPVTLLVGENGAGKSSVLQAMALTAQSATEDRNRYDLILSGSKVEFPVEAGMPYQDQVAAVCFRHDLLAPLAVGFVLRAGDAPPLRYEWSRAGRDWPSWSHVLASGEAAERPLLSVRDLARGGAGRCARRCSPANRSSATHRSTACSRPRLATPIATHLPDSLVRHCPTGPSSRNWPARTRRSSARWRRSTC